MDARRFDADGLTICPICDKHYVPDLKDRDQNVAIQVQYPRATPIQREQLITGICSDECWDGMFK